MGEPIPVNREVLIWARQSLGLSLEEVAARIKKSVPELESWEQGASSPTYAQLETLAYQVYKRPLAVFFFPNPPEEEDLNKSFRTLPEQELERIPARMRFLLRKVQVLQINLSELYGGRSPVERSILRELRFESTSTSVQMARRVREYLAITIAEQEGFGSPDDALRSWRDVLERNGVFVFKDSFRSPGRRKEECIEDAFSGFCVYDEEFPIIYVNNNKPKTRQIFTLFHELAHLLFGTGGIDTRIDDYLEYLVGDNRRIEILCNTFANEFLVPNSDFLTRIENLEPSQKNISDLADFYSVSREVILRKYLDLKRITPGVYRTMVSGWDREKKARGEGGGNYYLTRGVYFGRRYIEKVLGEYHRGSISTEQAAEYLGEKTKNLAGYEEWFFSQEIS